LNIRAATAVWDLFPIGQPTYSVLTKSGAIAINNTVTVGLIPADTSGLNGEHFHRLTITDFSGNVFKQKRGFITISPAIV